MPNLITNPFGAHRKVSSFVAMTDDAGEFLLQPTSVGEYRANAAIVKGQVLEWVAGTATVPLSVKPFVVSDGNLAFAGIALHDAAAGAAVSVCTGGPCLVKTGNVTAAAGTYYLQAPGTTDGTGAIVNTALATTTIIGAVFGVCIGTSDGVTYTPVFIKQF